MQTALAESFIGRLRDESLFRSLSLGQRHLRSTDDTPLSDSSANAVAHRQGATEGIWPGRSFMPAAFEKNSARK
jgi:hypothetical protein